MQIVDTSSLTQDSESGYAIPTGSGNGWYTYSGSPTFLISPTPEKSWYLELMTIGMQVEIFSYYLGAPENPDAFTDQAGIIHLIMYINQTKELQHLIKTRCFRDLHHQEWNKRPVYQIKNIYSLL